MIRNQWYAVLESREVPKNRAVGVTRMGEKLLFWRDAAGRVHCQRDLCPHLGARLSQGKVSGDHLACPFHGFEFDGSGACTYIPALGRNGEVPKAMRVAGYPVREALNMLWIWWGEDRADLPPLQYDLSLEDGFTYSSFQQHWPVHYSRMVENQLDVMHLAFIHATTIGRGGRSVVDGPLVRWDGNVMKLWVYNRLDDGSPALRMEDLPDPQRPPFLLMYLPNFWENRISEDLRITVAFVPVDEHNAILYGRYYQRMVRVPGLREFFNWTGKVSSIFIANQDRRVVSQQYPVKTRYKKMGEKPVQGDRAIMEYRRRRFELKAAAGQDEELEDD